MARGPCSGLFSIFFFLLWWLSSGHLLPQKWVRLIALKYTHFCFSRQLSVTPRTCSLFSCRSAGCLHPSRYLLLCSCPIYLPPILFLKVCPLQDTSCVTLIDFTSQPLTAKVHAAPPGIAFHVLVLISGCSTELPMQGVLSSFFLLSLQYWIIGFHLGSTSELAMELCKNKEAASGDYDSGWPDPLHLYKVL